MSRLLALAEILRADFVELLFVARASAALEELLQLAGLPLRMLPALAPAAEADWLRRHVLRATDVMVLDGYTFDFGYQRALRDLVHRLVCLDDLHAFPFAADVVLNPAGGVVAADYELRQPGARLLAGPAFAPLRAAFQSPEPLPANTPAVAGEAEAPADSAVVLLCLGGADPQQRAPQLAGQLLALPAPAVRELHVVVGAAYAGWEALREWAAAQPRLRLHRALPAAELAALMRRCGSAILSPSTVSYEYCATGGGLLFTFPTADNQHDLDHFLRGAGLALPASSAANVLTAAEAPQLAIQLRAAQRRRFDGQAPTRLRQAFAAVQLPRPAFQLRAVQAADSDLLLTWTNDPAVRHASFSPDPVSRATHEAWLRARLMDPQALLLLAEDDVTRAPLGLIRFQLADEAATLSYQLAPEWRGQGLAALLLRAGTEAVTTHFAGLRRLRGHVRADNLASVRAFERAGFWEELASGAPDRRDGPAGSLTFVWIV